MFDELTGCFETLPALEGFVATASVVNNFGVVCGFSRKDDRDCATLWERDANGAWTVTNLADMCNSVQAYSSVGGINDNMQIVGKSNAQRNDLDTQVAHLWEREADDTWTVTDLPGDGPGASDINNWGQIVGTHAVNGSRHVCIWEQVEGEWCLLDLSAFAADYSSCDARDINDLGQVVGLGNKISGGTAAYLYENGVMRNLNNFLPAAESGWSLRGAVAINNVGQVVGFGYNPAGAYRGFLMDTRDVTYSYTSTGSAVAIKDKSTASKSMTLSDNETITDLNVAVKLYHTRYQDLKIELVGPNNVTRVLCNAGALTGSGTKTIVFDDDGAAGSVVPAQPLSYYDNTTTQGKWTVRVSDTVRNGKTGTFYSFTLDVVPDLP